MTTYFKVVPPAPDALPKPAPPHSLLCVFKATLHYTIHLHKCTHTHVTRKSYDVLNDTTDILSHKVKLIARITCSTLGRVCNDGTRGFRTKAAVRMLKEQ